MTPTGCNAQGTLGLMLRHLSLARFHHSFSPFLGLWWSILHHFNFCQIPKHMQKNKIPHQQRLAQKSKSTGSAYCSKGSPSKEHENHWATCHGFAMSCVCPTVWFWQKSQVNWLAIRCYRLYQVNPGILCVLSSLTSLDAWNPCIAVEFCRPKVDFEKV